MCFCDLEIGIEPKEDLKSRTIYNSNLFKLRSLTDGRYAINPHIIIQADLDSLPLLYT